MKLLKFCALSLGVGVFGFPIYWLLWGVWVKSSNGDVFSVRWDGLILLMAVGAFYKIVPFILGYMKRGPTGGNVLYTLAIILGPFLAAPGLCGGPLALLYLDYKRNSSTALTVAVLSALFVTGWLLYRWGVNGVCPSVTPPMSPPLGTGPSVPGSPSTPPSGTEAADAPEKHKPSRPTPADW